MYRFLDLTLDPQRLELRRANSQIEVEPQVFSLLVYLIENRERVVTKDELIESVWDGRIVSDATMSSRISAARTALGDDGKAQRLIRTFPRRGFRFMSEVVEDEAVAASVAPAAPGLEQAPSRSTVSEKPTIAILPFKNMSGDAEQDYFVDGIAEDIITALSRFHWFFVISRNASFTYRDRTVEARRVAEDLGVRYVLEGSVRRAGNRVRITAQLVDATTGKQVWAERYDRELADIFAVQDEITNTIVGTIEPELGHVEREQARRKPPENIHAWDHFQRGLWHFYQFTDDKNDRARQEFRRAIDSDPDFSQAYAALANVHVLDVVYVSTQSRERSSSEALVAAKKAV
ncbi:MAG: winged helix-turn-helix domain-containing protein, partial [Candidatus Krumholzibacteria bacterium]